MNMYGLDVGGTKIELGIFTDECAPLHAWRVPTPLHSYQKVLDTIGRMVEQADEKSQGKGSVGIGLPAFIDAQGLAVSSNIPCINAQPLVRDLHNILGRPVSFESDVKAFVLSESRGGAATKAKSVLGIVLGTGLSGAQCIEGQLHHGRQKIAGEYGHIPLPALLQQRYDFPLRECGCGNLSCIEKYLSGPGLLWMCQHFRGNYSSVPAFVESFLRNDEKAKEIFAAYIDCLGCYFAQLTLMFDPDLIVLGGGLSNIEALYQQLPGAIEQYLFEGATSPAIVPPAFGDTSGVRGAALMGRQRSPTPLEQD